MITIIEHQSQIHYDMSFKILRYIVMVLTDYEAEQEKLHPNITKTKDFKYPPILPIVYYEGSQSWNAARNFKERTYLSESLGRYIIERRDFSMLFDSFEAYDVQETRRISREEGISVGKKEGISLGKITGKAESILELLSELETVPRDLQERILSETDLHVLSSWLRQSAKAESLQEFRKNTGI